MNRDSESRSVSVIVPAFNAGSRIGNCLEALQSQAERCDAEILVVDDGSSDNTSDVVQRYRGVRLIHQVNSGPASARNRGAFEARGEIIVFTDDDCVPAPGWLGAMLKPFTNPDVVGAKGVYRTRQKELIARFVQIEYEDRYRLMAASDSIDFVDTYSAAFRRNRFLEVNGFDTEFPLACAEDAELSYRMSGRGWKLNFVPEAVVYHSHPQTLTGYLKKKYKFSFWRVLAVRKNPEKALKDSHTPQVMKLQLFFVPALVLAAAVDVIKRPSVPLSAIVAAAFFVSTLPFIARALPKDGNVALCSAILLAARSGAQFLGVAAGLIYTRRKPVRIATKSAA